MTNLEKAAVSVAFILVLLALLAGFIFVSWWTVDAWKHGGAYEWGIIGLVTLQVIRRFLLVGVDAVQRITPQEAE